MKKKTVLKLLFIASCLVAVCSLFYNNETSTLDSLAFQNVEALASGETAKCTDSCKEWSGNSGGGIACDCGRYTGKCKNRC